MRLLLKLVFVIIFVGIIGLVALTVTFDINDYKQTIADKVSEATGRALVFEGDISLSLFPWLGLKLGPLSLGNSEGFSAKRFAHVGAVNVRVKLLPLLQKKVEIDTIVIDGLTLNLAINKDGKANWKNSTEAYDSAGDSNKEMIGDETMPSSSPGSMSALASVSIAGVRIADANINLKDESKGASYQLNNANFNISAITPDKPSSVTMSADFSSKSLALSGHVNVAANVMISGNKQQQYHISGFNITAKAAGATLPFSSVTVSSKGDLIVDGAKQRINLQLSELIAEAIDKRLPNGKLVVKAKAAAAFDIKAQHIALNNLAIALDDMIVKGSISATQLNTNKPRFTGQITTSALSLKKLADNFAIALPVFNDKSAFNLAKLSATFSGSFKHIDVTKLHLVLDESQLKGQFAIIDFAQPAVKFDLALDKLNIDRYLPPDTSKQQEQVASATSELATVSAKDEPLITQLRQLNVDGNINIGQLTLMGAQGKNIATTIKAADGLIMFSPVSADIYQGQYQGNIGLNAQGDTLKLSLNETLKNVQLGALLADLSGNDFISGIASLEIKLTADGTTAQNIKRTLNGQGQFSLKNGKLKGIGIADAIAKKNNPQATKLKQSDALVATDFANLSGSVLITDGVVHNQNLQLLSPLLRVAGEGVINLTKEKVNYNLNATVMDIDKEINKKLKNLVGLAIPVVISGDLASPKVTVDLASLIEQNAKIQAKKKLNDKLKDKLGDDLGKRLGDVLGIGADNPDDHESEEAEKSLNDKLKDALKEKLKTFF